MGAQTPEFVDSVVDDIPKTVAQLRSGFLSHKTRPVEFRLKQLRKLYWAIRDNEEGLLEACKEDLGKGFFDAMVTEIDWVKNDIIFMTKNLEKWMKDEKPADVSFSNSLVSPRTRKDPLGLVLVIGAFNFPIQLSLGPMIGAISGGNTVVLKPSEQTPNCAAMLQKVIEQALDQSCYRCLQGGIPQTSALLNEKWDKIFFTGSVNTARIVTKAAAANLTPVVLELGGKNPAIVTKKANIPLAARRLLWGKVMNAGQVCLSENYILADKEVVSTLVAELKAAMKEFFPNGAKASPDYARIVNIKAFNRIKKMLDNTSGKIVIGGTMDADQLFIEPTVVEVTDKNDTLVTEESFGPLIPILAVSNLDEAIATANAIHDTPLGVYAFGSKDETSRILAETRSGGATVNDAFFHAVIPTVAFGGVGDSGTGSYRGKASFDTFVHHRSIAATPNWMEKLLAVRYPPYTGTGKYKQFAKMSALKPNFDREGNEKVSLAWYILTLGTKSASRGMMRALLVAIVAFGGKALIDRRAIAAAK